MAERWRQLGLLVATGVGAWLAVGRACQLVLVTRGGLPFLGLAATLAPGVLSLVAALGLGRHHPREHCTEANAPAPAERQLR